MLEKVMEILATLFEDISSSSKLPCSPRGREVDLHDAVEKHGGSQIE
jgi:hypothetical protein